MTFKQYNLYSFLILSIIFLLSSHPEELTGQVRPYNEEITVISTFDPIVPDAFKLNTNPVINDTTTTVPAMKFQVMPRNAGIRMDIEQLPAVKLVAEPLAKLYRNYLRAGFGNYYSLYGELYASSLRSKSHLLGVHVKHFSSGGKIRDYGPTANATQSATLSGQKYFSNHTLDAEIKVKRNSLHLYGFRPSLFNDTSIDRKDLKQRYFTIGTDVSLSSRYRADDKLNHSFSVGYYYLSDLYDVKENNLKLGVNLNKRVDIFGWDLPQVASADVNYQFFNQSDSANKNNSGILSITPALQATYQEYSFKAGLGFYIGMDSVTKGHLYPMLEAKIDIIPGGLQIYAGIDGGMERNTLQSLSGQNPFLTSGLPLGFTYNKFRAYGGFTSNISKSFNFNGSISSTTFENYALFITDTLNPLMNTFTLLHDDASMLKIRAELEYLRTHKLRLSMAGTYYSYTVSGQEYAWYKPSFDLSFTVSYSMQEKIILKLLTIYQGSMWALAPTKVTVDGRETLSKQLSAQKIDGWLDVSLGAEYRLKKALSFWLNLNNLTNHQHMYWFEYPSYRLNVMLGANYSF